MCDNMVNLEDIEPSEISQPQGTNTVGFYMYKASQGHTSRRTSVSRRREKGEISLMFSGVNLLIKGG